MACLTQERRGTDFGERWREIEIGVETDRQRLGGIGEREDEEGNEAGK